MAQIGILGGSFHPIHNGHLALGQYCLDANLLEEVWYLPTGCSYLKARDNMLSGEERLHLVELAISGNEKMRALDLEIRRPGYTYTYETLEEIHKLYPEHSFSFIVGADCLFQIENWKETKRIFDAATLMVAGRGNFSKEEMQRKADFLKDTYQARIQLIPFPEMNISSTEIRRKIAAGENVSDLLPAAVLQEIQRKKYFIGS